MYLIPGSLLILYKLTFLLFSIAISFHTLKAIPLIETDMVTLSNIDRIKSEFMIFITSPAFNIFLSQGHLIVLISIYSAISI